MAKYTNEKVDMEMKTNNQEHNFNPHKEAVIAMWIFGEEYADLGLGSMDYYNGLSDYNKKLCSRMLEDVEEAPTK